MRTNSSPGLGGANSMSAMVMGRDSAKGRGDPMCSSTAPRICVMIEYNHEFGSTRTGRAQQPTLSSALAGAHPVG
jgi:hypothetical protein